MSSSCYVAEDEESSSACGTGAGGGGGGDENEESLVIEEEAEDAQEVGEQHAQLVEFWEKIMADMHSVTVDDFKQQALPLARIKRIMKLDDEVKMISSEAPLLFAKAAEIFIHELTLRAWMHTEENKRRTLQKNDINFAAAKSDQYDFLIDILPPDEIKVRPKEDPVRAPMSPNQVQYYLQLAQQHQAALQQPQMTAQTIQAQPIQQAQVAPQMVQVASASAPQTLQAQPNLQIVQQIVTPSGEIQHIPLSGNQLNLLRQMQGATNQPIIIQTVGGLGGGQPQIIQLQQQAHPIFLTQVAQVPDSEMIT